MVRRHDFRKHRHSALPTDPSPSRRISGCIGQAKVRILIVLLPVVVVIRRVLSAVVIMIFVFIEIIFPDHLTP